ncbi:transcriptional regulator, TetR family [Arboricoccus pini]|uniref:Transcriptional regulator, TetR family n=1 Tax=Arboricoccus pini TaxID=1963835 RepID=A0A212S339_9PROT|nr:TetR family transcriptional regulator [Arboricoccus pini]SNB79540.1 transcriptional regulator, TetR family [Arboricoccus pini]
MGALELPASSGRALPPDGRAAAILDAALDLFSTRDFASVSMREVADRCGVNVALIYYYFAGKNDLCHAALELAVNRTLERYRARSTDGNPVGALTDWFNVNIEMFESLRKMARIMIAYRGSLQDDRRLNELIDYLYERERQILRACLEDGMAAGLFRRLDVDRTIRFISIQIDGLLFVAMTRPSTDIKALAADSWADLQEHVLAVTS